MIYMVSIIHLLACVFVVIFILLQDPKGGVLGALGGGGSSGQSLFGAGGASNFLVKATKWLAIVFACTSIYLSYKGSHQESDLMSKNLPQVETEKANPAEKKKDSGKTNPSKK
ncbi:MAG: preprotein translocase subunit SecG [Bdellovibrionales bacterium]